jgi:hypothetical protein
MKLAAADRALRLDHCEPRLAPEVRECPGMTRARMGPALKLQTSNKDRTGVDEGSPTPVRDCRGSGECASSKRDERLAPCLLFPWRFSGDFPAAAAAITADYPPSAQMSFQSAQVCVSQRRVKPWRLIASVAPNAAACFLPQTRCAPSPQPELACPGYVAGGSAPYSRLENWHTPPLHHRPALRSRRGWRSSHCAITAAMAALFFSSIIM